MMTRGDILRPWPVIRGSITFPMMNCITMMESDIRIKLSEKPNCRKAIKMGQTLAIIEPRLGMKFKMNMRNPKKMARSRLKSDMAMVHRRAVPALTTVLISRYREIFLSIERKKWDIVSAFSCEYAAQIRFMNAFFPASMKVRMMTISRRFPKNRVNELKEVLRRLDTGFINIDQSSCSRRDCLSCKENILCITVSKMDEKRLA